MEWEALCGTRRAKSRRGSSLTFGKAMETETIELIRYALSQTKEAALVILPAVVAGYFALKAGRRDAKLEVAKLRAEQEFSARTRFYDYLKEQQSRIQTSHTALTYGIEKVLVGYHEGVTKIDIAMLGDDDAAKEKAKLLQIIQPMLDTFLYSLREPVTRYARRTRLVAPLLRRASLEGSFRHRIPQEATVSRSIGREWPKY